MAFSFIVSNSYISIYWSYVFTKSIDQMNTKSSLAFAVHGRTVSNLLNLLSAIKV